MKAVADWLKAKPGRNGTPPVFRLFGYAGTGKTTLARHIAEAVDGEVKFAARVPPGFSVPDAQAGLKFDASRVHVYADSRLVEGAA